jgi:hypothetical protein
VAIIIGSVCGVVALFLVLGALYALHHFKKTVDLSILPEEVRWWYEQFYKNPNSWKTEGKFGFEIFLENLAIFFFFASCGRKPPMAPSNFHNKFF